MFQHILVPTDGSPLSDQALDRAIALARGLGARLTILNATAEPPFPVTNFGEDGHYDPEKTRRFAREAASHGQRIIDAALARAREAGVKANPVVESSETPHRVIIQTAESLGCDLICMASHGRRGINALLLGSETNKVLAHCTIPVLVCR
ncbi:universal stress protein [Aromatoleum evansii]|uniref:Universal stress protein n=1 Tax=Aromatoleum evansii TaxID=59406 RepID=A0ABZ1AKP1_AROEV|nr:universal stress protein [Aromatoleum evansii]NMG31802.1 universal stress protein [Aromatoleum evansii]WRL46435.1 universal stress protein [Aromatoleum evansii]